MNSQNQHSLIMKFEGTQEQYKRLLASFKSGELEQLLKFPIQDVRISSNAEQVSPVIAQKNETVEQVLQRIYHTLESGWQTVESLKRELGINPLRLAAGWRGAEQLNANKLEVPAEGFMRVKPIYLDLLEVQQHVALIVALMPGSLPDEVDILVEVRPMQGQTTLPPDLQLMVIDYKGATALSAQANKGEPKITFAFTGNIGEPFSVKLALNNFSYTQEFPI